MIEIKIKEKPSKKDALEACEAWFDAEDNNLGTFDQRTDLCNYSDWAVRKALGRDVGEFEPLKRLVLVRK